MDNRMLYERLDFLENVIGKYEKKYGDTETLSDSQKGASYERIRAIRHGKGFQYYERESGKDKNGKYIRMSEIDKVRISLQKDYDREVYLVALREYNSLLRYLNVCKMDVVENIYSKMSPGKQNLVVPVIETEDSFIEKWKNYKYEKMGFESEDLEYYAISGLRVRSKSEILIANLLEKMEIPFLYEMPLFLPTYGTVRPDFTLIDVKRRRLVYFEHFGMMDDYSYRNNAVAKIQAYEAAGYYLGDKLFVSEESSKCPLNIKVLERKLRHFFL